MDSGLLSRIRLNLKARTKLGQRNDLYPQDEAIIEEFARDLAEIRTRLHRIETRGEHG